MKNGWTGAQYSIFRAALGLYLVVHFAALLPYATEMFSDRGVLSDAWLSPLARAFPNVLVAFDAPWVPQAALVVCVALSLALLAGWRDRIAAVALWYFWACLFGRNPLIANPSIPFVGWMLLAHACLPPAPYGSWAARGRPDARGGWSFPAPIFFAAWLVMAAGYSYGGYTKLVSTSWIDGTAIYRVIGNPLARPGLIQDALLSLPPAIWTIPTWIALALELLFLPLALVARARPLLWLALLGMHFGLMVLIDFADLSAGMVLIHLLTFDPAWIAPIGGATLHHGGSAHLQRFVASEGPLPVVPGGAFGVLRADGVMLSRSDAVLHLGEALGGIWRLLAIAARIVPRRWRDHLLPGSPAGAPEPG